MFGPTNLDEVFVQMTYIEAGKTGVVYQGNRLQGKRTKGSGMARRQIQWQERKRSPLVSIPRKKGMMRTVVGNCIPRRDQSSSRKIKGGK